MAFSTISDRDNSMDSHARAFPADLGALICKGQVIGDKYEIGELVGESDIAFFVSALHLELNTRVALKFLRPEFMVSQDALRVFAGEARTTLKIKSAHVSRVLDGGHLPQGAPFIVMELLRGRDLGQELRLHGPLPIERATTYALQACEALACAHSTGAIHHNIKPLNLFVSESPPGPSVLKVLEFGTSIPLTEPWSARRVPAFTRTLLERRSPHYMSPEEIRSPHLADARTDIWSLGCVLYELLSGITPFAAPSLMQVCVGVLEEEPPALSSRMPSAPPELESVVMRCLQKDPRRRFQNAAELALALLPFAAPSTRPLVQRCADLLASDARKPIEASRDVPPPKAARRRRRFWDSW